jgi:transcriptional regulator with XRE-family HTH domain
MSTLGKRYPLAEFIWKMSQTELGDAIGLTFQQVQKYEKGMNRVGASRLQQISEALGVSPFYFFEGAPTVGKKAPAPNEGELSEDTIVSFLGTREGAALVRGFLAIRQKPIRQNLIAFIDTLKVKWICSAPGLTVRSEDRGRRRALSMRLCRYRLPTHLLSFGDRLSGKREVTRIAFEGL